MDNITRVSGFEGHGDGTLAALQARRQARNIDLCVLLNIAASPESVAHVNDYAIRVDREEGICAFGSVHPSNDNFAGEIARLRDAGIKGIKLHPCYQKFMIDDPAVFPVYEAIVKAGMLVLFHAGLDPLDPTKSYATPRASLKMHRLFPEMKMILAHLGGAREFGDAERCLWGEDIYMDISCMAGYAPGGVIRRFFKKHRMDRILYGSDFPWHDGEELKMLDTLPLSREQKEAVLAGNARALLGLEGI